MYFMMWSNKKKKKCLKLYSWYYSFKSSRPELFCKKGVLKNFTKFRGKHLCQSLFFNKVADLSPTTLLKTRLWHRFFPVNFSKFLRAPFFSLNTSGGCFCSLQYRTLGRLVFEKYADSDVHIIETLQKIFSLIFKLIRNGIV